MTLSQLTRRMRMYAAANDFRVRAVRLARLFTKYSPDQPRAPAGRPDGGQWVPWNRLIASPFDGPGRAICDTQYESDVFQCKFVASARSRRACEEQAMVRYVSCLKDQPLPPHNYYLGDSR